MATQTQEVPTKQGEQKKPGQRGNPNYCNDIGFITANDLLTKTNCMNRLIKIAEEKGLDEPEALAKLCLQLAVPKGHPNYMSTRKACEMIYPKKITTQSIQMKAGELMFMFLQELLYGIETKDIIAQKEMEKAEKGPGRKRLDPIEKISREAYKVVNTGFREANDLQPVGAIPKDKRDTHEQYVHDNVENVVKSMYKEQYGTEPAKADVEEMKKRTIQKAL